MLILVLALSENLMRTKSLIFCLGILFLFSSCDTIEPQFDPDKIFVEVKNGTVDSDGEFEVFNFSSETIFIHYSRDLTCNLFTYSLEQLTDSGWVKLSFDSSEETWMIPIINPDSIIVCIAEDAPPPIELKSLDSFEQKITGLDQIGEYRLTISYTLSGVPSSSYNKLIVNYKVGY